PGPCDPRTRTHRGAAPLAVAGSSWPSPPYMDCWGGRRRDSGGGNMLTSHPAKVLHIYANSTDQWHGRPLYSAIIHKCLQLGIAGATAFRSFEGYGMHHQLHTARLLSLSEDLPVRIEVVDTPDAIDR